jgi:nucleoid-associated protein EbfC
MGDMYKMAREAKAIQKKLRKKEITAESKGGGLEVTVNAEMKLLDVKISEDVLKPENKSKIERSFKETLNTALKKAQQVAAEETKDLMGGMGL